MSISSVSLFGKLSAPKSAPITADLDGWKPIAGSPSMKTWIENKTSDGKFLTGYWEAMPGTYHVTYKADELIHLFEGKFTLTEDGTGNTAKFSAGDTLHIAAGFSGTWKTEEKIRKIFAIRVA